MSILAGARMKRPEEGYAIDFVTVALRSVLKQAVEQGIRIVSNAGGVNPKGCAAAVQALADELGVKVRIAVVEGDDVLPLAAAMRAAGTVEMSSGEPMPRTAGDGQCLPRRAAGRARARRGRRHRHHRPLRRQRGHPRRADARVRLGGRRLRPARRGQPRRPHHRMRLPGDGRLAHRLGRGARLGQHRLSDRRVPRRRQLRRHQAAGDRRARHAGDGRRATAVRDRRSGQLPAAGRGVRLPPGAHGTGRAASRARDRRARPPADRHLQGQRHRAGGLQGVRAAHHRRHRCPREGQAHRRGAARARPPAAARERVRGLPRHEHRAARHRVRLRAACPAVADARSRAAPDGHACRPARAGDVQPRVRRTGHVVVAGHHRVRAAVPRCRRCCGSSPGSLRRSR